MRYVIGVDEAGRGPLAGPVAVGLVRASESFDVAREFPGVKDSKQLSPKKREVVYALLEERAKKGDVRFVVEFESAEAIDTDGIASVIRRAIARGVDKLASEIYGGQTSVRRSDLRVLLDGALRAPREYSQETIIGGDESVPIISLASVAAKVERDRLMVEFAHTYPLYGFEQHKGYGTKAHYAALREHGLSAIHRRSFIHLDFPRE